MWLSSVVVLLSLLPVVYSSRDRSGLIFSYLSPVALGISSCSVVLLIIAVVVSCYFDNKGRSGLPKSVQQFPSRIWVPRAKQIRDEVEHQMSMEPASKSSKSDEEPATAIQVGDIEEEARHFRTPSVQRHISSRMDPTEKHNRIIEAIYQASGRDLPEEYKTQGGAANVHGIRSREMKKAQLEVIKEADETAATQRTLTEKTEKKPQKSAEKITKKNDGDLTEDKTMSVEEPKDDTKKQAEEKKVADEKKSMETAVEAKKETEEKKAEKATEKKEEKKEEDKKEDDKKTPSKEQIVTMEEIKEDQKKVEEKKKEEKEKKEVKKEEKQDEKSEKTETEKTEKTDEASISMKTPAQEETPKKGDKMPPPPPPQQK